MLINHLRIAICVTEVIAKDGKDIGLKFAFCEPRNGTEELCAYFPWYSSLPEKPNFKRIVDRINGGYAYTNAVVHLTTYQHYSRHMDDPRSAEIDYEISDITEILHTPETAIEEEAS